MRAFLSVLCLLIAFPMMATAKDTAAYEDPYQKEYAKDYAAAYAFQKALAAGDKQKVAKMVYYPLQLPLPLKSIQNAKEFVKHWDWFFNDKEIAFLTKPEEVGHMGWRGVSIGPGSVWFYAERVTAIQTWTPAFDKALEQAMQEEQNKLHPLVGAYESIDKECDTDSQHVRIHSVKTSDGSDYRLIIWDKKSKLSNKPITLIDHAEYENMGSAHNEEWKFKQGDMTYQLETLNVCGEDCNEYLTVYKNDDEVSKEVCLTAKRRGD